MQPGPSPSPPPQTHRGGPVAYPGRAASQPRQRLRWVASPPPGAGPPPRRTPDHRYHGPPSYPVPPRWGFPSLVWRQPTVVPGTASNAVHPAQRVRLLARNTTALLWTVGALALLASGGEFWRYVLLVQSRNSALSTGVVGASDALVVTASLLTSSFGLIALVTTLWWLYVARMAAADAVGEDPPRPPWQVAVAVLVPLLNLVMAGSVVAELEHTVLRRPATERPRPSVLVRWWWAAWAVNGLLLIITLWFRFRDGIQAQADAVLLSGLLDLAAAAFSVLTVLVVRRMTELLAPIDDARLRRLRVLKVTGAPEPALRARPAGAVR